MRYKKIIVIILFFILSTIVWGKGYVGINGKFLFSSDSNYKRIYGNSQFYPELEVGLDIYKGIVLFGSYGYFSQTGKTEGELKEDTKSTKEFLSFGAGYKIEANEKIYVLIKVGVSRIDYKEESMGEIIKNNKIGLCGEVNIIYNMSKRLYTKIFIGYMGGKDKIDDVDIKLGGFTAGLGLGIRF
jgi:hypothetical protein